MKKFAMALIVAVAVPAATTFAAPVSVDGTIGAGWSGVPRASVTHNDNAPTNNFDAPSNTTAGAAYDVLVRDDGQFYYVGLDVTGSAASSAGAFANIYVDTDPQNMNGSDLGFEIGSNGVRAFDFDANDNPQFFDASAYTTSSVNAGAIEFAVSNSFFTDNPLSRNYLAAIGNVTVRLSQSFGYSVAGGASYGTDRLGTASVVPEPSSIAIGGLAATGLLIRRRKVAR